MSARAARAPGAAGVPGAARAPSAFAPYLAIAAKSFRRYTTYRIATLAGLATNLFFGLLRSYVFLAVLKGGADLAGYTKPQLLAYCAWTQAMIPVLHVWGSWELMVAIRSGAVVSDLCRPLNFYLMWQSADSGRALQGLLARSIPLMVGYSLFFPLSLPSSPVTWLTFGAAVFLAQLVGFAWRFLVNSLAFWALDARGLMTVAFMLALFLMGFMVPVDVFPPWLRTFVAHTPFPSMIQFPLDVITARVAGAAALRGLATQCGWLLALWLIAGAVVRAGTRKLVIQGG
jgi:ABC-2 type transport system permease protein